MSETWARSFGSSATGYDDCRPPLPAAVCSWLGVKPDWDVVDVGAGTARPVECLGHRVRTLLPWRKIRECTSSWPLEQTASTRDWEKQRSSPEPLSLPSHRQRQRGRWTSGSPIQVVRVRPARLTWSPSPPRVGWFKPGASGVPSTPWVVGLPTDLHRPRSSDRPTSADPAAEYPHARMCHLATLDCRPAPGGLGYPLAPF